jgi:pyruvate dehydrogenase E1 component
VKKLDAEGLRHFRDRFDIPLSDEQLEKVPYYRPPPDNPEIVYMRRQRERLGGSMPRRVAVFDDFELPGSDVFKTHLEGTGERAVSTTMVFVRLLQALVRHKSIGPRIVPIVPDEARTFGMEGMFRQLGIYSSEGQLYEPEDSGEIAAYRESKEGQVLEEGITEAGAFCAWLAAATAYSSHRLTLVPFYIYYSMFGFQRIGDLAWAAGDMQARGFLVGGTAGRTTLNGEGLQHQDGHSHLLASTIPNCRAYDPAYGYELAVIVQHGLERMYGENERVFYYVTVMNENYVQPPMPDDEAVREGIVRGMYRLESRGKKGRKFVRLLGSGTILREVAAAAEMLEELGVASEVWSATSFSELAREGHDVQRWNMLHPEEKPRTAWVTECLGDSDAPIVAATDYMKAHADQIRGIVPASYRVLGTDGFGRSDSRSQLRHFFEVDRRFVTVAALQSLAERQLVPQKLVRTTIEKLDLDPEKPNPRLV